MSLSKQHFPLIFTMLFSLMSFLDSSDKIITKELLKNAQIKINKEGFTRNGTRKILKIYDERDIEQYKLQRVCINSDKSNLDTCIITYSSLNKNYLSPNCIKNHIKALKNHNFEGHFLYRIGGWPNMENGCLSHCETPYFFKFCALKEALNLGYKTIIWVDLTCQALSELTPLLNYIKNHGIAYRYSRYPFHQYCSEALKRTFNLSERQVRTMKHIAAGVMCFNAKSPEIRNLINNLHKTHCHKQCFRTKFPEQLVMSILINRAHLQNCAYPNINTFEFSKKIPVSRYPFVFGDSSRAQLRGQKIK